MKTFFTLLALAFSGVVAAQSGTSGKLLYSDTAKEGLRHIVDSLNLDFRASESKIYKAPMQGRGDYFFIKGDEAHDALKDIEAGVTFRQMADKYPKAEMQPDILVVRTKQEVDTLKMTSFSVVSMGYLMPSVFFQNADDAIEKVIKGWIYNYDEKENAINAFYFSKEMTAPELPERYSRMLQYKDHLMPDGNAIYFDYAWECTPPYIYIAGPKMQAFYDDLNSKLKRPAFDDENMTTAEMLESDLSRKEQYEEERKKSYRAELDKWEATRMARVDSLMQKNTGFRKLFSEALDEARNHLTVTDEEFEEYAEIYASKEDALYFKRCRKVATIYPEDKTPYLHRIDIARLAAETLNWGVYIAAQTEILNEKLMFTKEYDAEIPDITFVKELEAINVNVVDFLLGCALKTDDTETYFGLGLFKLSRPFAEAFENEYAGNSMLAMIADNELDGATRVMMYKIYLGYWRLLRDPVLTEKNLRRLEEAMAFLPEYLIMTRPD